MMKAMHARSWFAALLALMLLPAFSFAAKDKITNLFQAGKVESNDDEYLKPDEAFKFSAEMTRPDSVTLSWIIAEGYYLYQERIKASTESTIVQLGALQFPEGQPKKDDLGDHIVYHNVLTIPLPVARAADAKGEFKVKVTYQGCAEKGLCYNPITKITTLTLTSASTASTLDGKASSNSGGGNGGGGVTSEQDFLAGLLTGSNLAYALLMFFLAGVGLSFTPCVLPMIPILSGIIV